VNSPSQKGHKESPGIKLLLSTAGGHPFLAFLLTKPRHAGLPPVGLRDKMLLYFISKTYLFFARKSQKKDCKFLKLETVIDYHESSI